MKSLSSLLVGLIVLALASPMVGLSRPACRMACCQVAAHSSCPMGMKPACTVGTCGSGGGAVVASLPSLPVSTLTALPDLDLPAVAGWLPSRPATSVSSTPRALPERPPRV